MNSTVSIFGAVRTLRRAQLVLRILTKFGFENLIADLGLQRFWAKGKRLFGIREATNLATLPLPERVRRMLEQLGPTYIKIGQILSTRPDLIPREWADEFRNLQSDVAAVPWSHIEPTLAAEFPDGLDAVFESVEKEPIAAASIAQVHRAVMKDGRRVVLKILRPRIKEVIAADMEIIGALANLMQARLPNLGYDPVKVVHEFAKQLERETDLRLEGRMTDRMRQDFADNPRVSFPVVHWDATTERVLALEEIQGTLLSKLDPAELTAEQRRRIVQNGADAVFYQCLRIGLFHADPHPGNIFILSGERVCFIDAGMTGTIDPETIEQLAQLVYATIEGDLDGVIEVAETLTQAPPTLSNDRAFRAEVWKFMSALRVDSLADIQFGLLLNPFFDMLQEFELLCPADLMHLVKAVTTIEGVAESIDPEFDVIGHVRPYLEELVVRRYSITTLRRRAQSAALGYMQLAEDLPSFLRDTFKAIRRDRLSLHVEHKGLELLPRTIDNASMTIGYALLISSMVIGSSVLLLAGSVATEREWLFWLAGFGFLLSFGLAIFRLLLSFWRGRV